MAAQSILLTRPADASARFAALLRDRLGQDAAVVIAPLMAPVFLDPVLPAGPFDALILTSETGVEAARRRPAGLPALAFCVGDRTAHQAAAAGFHPRSAQGDAGALVTLILHEMPKGRLLYLHGADSRGDVAGRLRANGLAVDQATVYDQRPCPLTEDALALLAGPGPVLLPLFSPRSADLMAATGRSRARLWVAALSVAVADHAGPLMPEKIAVAERPDAEAMLRAVQSLWDIGRQT